jgi:hypothetical protein
MDYSKYSSKGNQFKFRKDGNWYKRDFLGYEGASEYICSEILRQSNITRFVPYEILEFQYNHEPMRGCVSRNFLPKDAKLITVSELYETAYKEKLGQTLQFQPVEEKIRFTVDMVRELTGLNAFGEYLTTLLELDAFILNEDRHFNNIALLQYEDESFDYCPIFDNGAAFLSDTTMDYDLSESDTISMIGRVQAKPFSRSFTEQTEIARSLYGRQLQLHKSVYLAVNKALTDIRNLYGDKITDRIYTAFIHQTAVQKDIFVKTLTVPVWEDVLHDRSCDEIELD